MHAAVVLLAACLVLATPAAAWEADTNWYDTNLWADEYVISTADELAGLAVIANTEHQFGGKTVKLGADIDLENQEWTPIGIWDDSSDFPECFSGVFDGQGHTISNLYISNDSLSYVGLFGFASEATISNLTLVNVNVTGTNTDSEYGIDVGALVGFFDGGSAPEQTIITNCSVIGGTVSSISEMSRVGGLVGSTRYGPEISQCYAEVRVIGDSVVGGIVGNHNQAANMNYCTAKCTIITEGIAGGLVGCAADNSNIFASVADCDIQGYYDVGGIVGEFYGGDITDCFVNINITTTGTLSQSGGIVGTAGYETTNITNCYSTGSIVVSNKYSIPYTEGNGGLIGSQSQYAQGPVNIINSVSLMQYVYGFESTGRLAGTGNVNVVNSYAWEGMTNNGVLFSDGGINGTSVSSDLFWNNQSFFADVLGWDFTNTWKMNSGNANAQLPVLKFQQTPVAGDVSYLTSTVVPDIPDVPAYSEDISIPDGDVNYIGDDVVLSGTAQPSSSIYFYLVSESAGIAFSQVEADGNVLSAAVDQTGSWSVTIPGSELYDESNLPLSHKQYTLYLTYLSSAESASVIEDSDTPWRIFNFDIGVPFLSANEISDFELGSTIITTGGAYGADSIVYYLFNQNGVIFGNVETTESEGYTISIPTTSETFTPGQYWMVIQHPMFDGTFNINPVINDSSENSVDIVLEHPAGNLTTPGTLFTVPTISGKDAVDELEFAISELKNMDTCVVLPFNITPSTYGTSLSISVRDNVLTQGQTLELDGETTLPAGTNLTLVLCEGDINAEYEVIGSLYLLVEEGSSNLNIWNFTDDTTDYPPGEYFVLIAVTDNEDFYAGPISFVIEEKIPEPARISISPVTVTINATEHVDFTATVYDEQGEVIEDVAVSWITNLPMKGSGGIIDQTGKFTTTEDASGDISVLVYPKGHGKVNATAVVTVIPLQASSVQFTSSTPALEVGDEFIFAVEVKDQLGNPFDGYVEWWVDNPTVGTVEKDGTFTAKEIGVVNVTAGVDVSGKGDYVSSTIQVSVVAAVPVEIILEPETASVNCTDKVSFSAVVKDKRGNVISDAPISWSVDTTDFGTIDSTGNFTAVTSLIEEDGIVTVTASPTGCPGITATATVNVIGFHATEILLTSTSTTLEIGDETTITAVVKDQFGNTLDVPVTWTSSDSNIGTVSNGVVTAVQKGTTTIAASAGSASNYTEIIVIAAVPREISISPVSATINATEGVQFTLTVKDKFGHIIENAPVQWEIDRDVGFVLADGNFTSYDTADGTVNITAHALGTENVNATVRVTIIPLHADNLTLIAVPQGTLEVNETFQFTAEVKDQLGNLFDTEVSWASDNEAVGIIDAAGNFTALSIGSANVTASVGELRITQLVSVVPAVPYEIEIDPASAVLNYTESVKFNVTIKDKRGDVIESPFGWTVTETSGTLADNVFTASEKLIEKNEYIVITVTPEANATIRANATIQINGFFATEVTITNKTTNKPVETALELNPGQTYLFNATVSDQFGNAFPEGYDNLTWKSKTERVGIIANGLFTAKAVGETTISAVSGNTTQTVLIKVFEKVKPEIGNVKIEHASTETMISGNTAVNITIDTSEDKTEVKVDTTKNETTIKDKTTNVTLVISFSKMENTTSASSQSIEGNITAITAEYPKMNVTANENVAAPVTFEMNLNLKNLTTNLPTVIPVINEEKKEQVRQMDDFKHHEIGAMVEIDSSINSNLSSAELVFYIPKDWVSEDKLKVLHIKEDNSVQSHSAFKVTDNDDETWKVTITANGFSAYAVTKDTYVAPSTDDSNKPTYPTGSSKPSTVTPVTPPEEPVEPETPTDVPGDVPSDIPGTTPSEPGKSPAPILGVLVALGAAVVLRRK